MNINDLIKRAHDNAVKKGFYDYPVCSSIGHGFMEGGTDAGMYLNCNGTGKADKNIGELLMLIVSELGEALEAHRRRVYQAV